MPWAKQRAAPPPGSSAPLAWTPAWRTRPASTTTGSAARTTSPPTGRPPSGCWPSRPGCGCRVRANRAFLGRAVRYLAGEAGIRQFLDIGTGIPAADNTHEVAQRVAPDARVVYVDNDPIVLAHARALLRSTPQGATDYLQADLRDPGRSWPGGGRPGLRPAGRRHAARGAAPDPGLRGPVGHRGPADGRRAGRAATWRSPIPRSTSTAPRRTRSGSTTSASPPRRRCVRGSRWLGSSPALNWSSRGWCRSTSGGQTLATSPRKGWYRRMAPWRASPVSPGKPG